jgi:hypothetical protein
MGKSSKGPLADEVARPSHDSIINAFVGCVQALQAELDALKSVSCSAGPVVQTEPVAVCACGPRPLFGLICDEDGLCVSCGCDVIVVVDLHSAELVVDLMSECDNAAGLAADLISNPKKTTEEGGVNGH